MHLNFSAVLRCLLVLMLNVKANELEDGLLLDIDSTHTPTCIRDEQVSKYF
jgi:hypothetical protein